MSKPFGIVLACILASLVPADHEEPRAPRVPSHPGAATPSEWTARASLTGRIVVRTPAPDPPPALSPYARRRSVPPQDPGTPGGAEDAFVYLERANGTSPGSDTAPFRIGQSARTITPHVSAVQVGQLVEFPNDDDVFHNIFSLSAGNSFSLGRYAPGTTETTRFDEPGVVRLFCDIHSEMAGVILVVDTPYLTRVEPDGTYALANVPPGEYRAIAWHPTAGADTTAVTLGSVAEMLDFVLGGGP